jgi:hypothetical protein
MTTKRPSPLMSRAKVLPAPEVICKTSGSGVGVCASAATAAEQTKASASRVRKACFTGTFSK